MAFRLQRASFCLHMFADGLNNFSKQLPVQPALSGDPGETCFNESLKEIEPCNPGPDDVTPADCPWP